MEPKVTKSIDWEYALKKPGATCCVSGRKFEIGDEYVSFIAYDAESGWQRADMDPDCFEALDDKPFAYWRARISEPEAKKARPLDLNFLTEFFVRLQEQKNENEHMEVGYIVTLLLVRKKVLKQLGMIVEDEAEFLEVRFTKEKDGKTYKVPVPEINAKKMDIIRDDLGRIFNLDDGAAEKQAPAGDELDAMMVEDDEAKSEIAAESDAESGTEKEAI